METHEYFITSSERRLLKFASRSKETFVGFYTRYETKSDLINKIF